MSFDRDLQGEINRTAHLLAQQQYLSIRARLMEEVRARLRDRSAGDVFEWLASVAAGKVKVDP